MPILYLDVDDEITSAATRIRSAPPGEVALVLQAGSRIATSRINFRLLAREAEEHGRTIAIVSPEASARALAGSAGLAVFATVMEFEEAQRDEASRDGGAAGTAPGPAGVAATGTAPGPAGVAAAGAAGAAHATSGMAGAGGQGLPAGAGAGGGAGAASTAAAVGAAVGIGAAAAAAPGWRGQGGIRDRGGVARASGPGATAGGSAGGSSGPRANDVTRAADRRPALDPTTGMADRVISVTPRRRRRWRRVLVLLIVLAALAAGGVTGYTVLPGATVTLNVRSVPVGPVRFLVRANTGVLEPDAATGVIPAVSLPIDLVASGTFKATGKRVEEATASGTVRWLNCDPTQSYTIPKGTTVRTDSGIAFQTVETVFVPVAILNLPNISCQARTVGVTAAKPGPAGNVPKGTITVVPGQYNNVVVRVTNQTPTSGGTHQEFPKIQQKDVDAALATLTAQIDEQMAAAVADPDGLPAGATVYPETAVRSDPVPDTDVNALVGQEVETFDLGVTASGSVLAVDPSPITEIGKTRISASVPSGTDLVPGSEVVTWGDGVPAGQEVTFAVSGTASALPRVDETRIREAVRGKSPDEARDALADLGDATITLWPDWSRTITPLDMRLEVKIQGLPAHRPPGSSASPSPSAPTLVPLSTATPSPASPAGSPSPDASPSGERLVSPAGERHGSPIGGRPPAAMPAS